MSDSIVVYQQDPVQRGLLVEIISAGTDQHIYDLGDFDELVDVISRQNFSLVFMELIPGDEDQLQWLGNQDDYVVGIINRKWEGSQLDPFLEAGLSDYIFKPYQPPRLKRIISKLSNHF